jgi:hypothetical protein
LGFIGANTIPFPSPLGESSVPKEHFNFPSSLLSQRESHSDDGTSKRGPNLRQENLTVEEAALPFMEHGLSPSKSMAFFYPKSRAFTLRKAWHFPYENPAFLPKETRDFFTKKPVLLSKVNLYSLQKQNPKFIRPKKGEG